MTSRVAAAAIMTVLALVGACTPTGPAPGHGADAVARSSPDGGPERETSRSSVLATTGASADAGAGAFAGQGAGTSDAKAPRCGTNAWSMFGHDAARTSASDGCVDGALRVAARFEPRGLCGYKSRAGRVNHAIADGEAAFASGDCGGAPAVWRVEPSGTSTWAFSRADYSRSSWPALAGDAVVSTDDGVFLIDRRTGKWRGRELDVWGEPISTDGNRFYVDNTWQLDSAGPFVGSFDATLHWVWKASRFDGARGKNVADVGGIALAGGLVVHAAAAGPRGAPTLSAYDAENGERRWSVSGSWPESTPSAFDGRVFTLERLDGEKTDRLVARELATGVLAWSQPVGWGRGTPPPVTPKLVLVHTTDALSAFDRVTGAPAWSVPMPRVTPQVQSATTVAVALGSNTAVVTSGGRLVLVRLEDGHQLWSEALVRAPSSVIGSPIVVGRAVYVVTRTLMGGGELLRLEPAP